MASFICGSSTNSMKFYHHERYLLEQIIYAVYDLVYLSHIFKTCDSTKAFTFITIFMTCGAISKLGRHVLIYPCVCLYAFPFVYVFVHLSVYFFFHLYLLASPNVCLLVLPSICLFAPLLSVYLLPFYLSFCFPSI